MKIAICEWVTPIKGPSIFSTLKGMGIDGIQLDDWDGTAQNHPLTDKTVQKIYQDASEETGVELIGIGGNALGHEGGMIHPFQSAKGQECWRTFCAGMDACMDMQLEAYLAPAFFEGFARTQADRKNIIHTMKRACDYAKGSNIKVTLESVFSAQELDRISQSIHEDNFGVFYDTQNPVTYRGIDVAEDIRALGDKIVQIHVKDGVDSIQGSLPLGEGETEFFRSAEAICEIGYDGWIILENYYSRPVYQSKYQSPWDRIVQDVETVRKAFHI